MLKLIERGDLSEMSFGINPGKATTGKAPDGKPMTTYTDVDTLLDISPVSLPAFEGTSIQLHSAADPESVASQTVKARHRARASQGE
jgi:hypothetical protein